MASQLYWSETNPATGVAPTSTGSTWPNAVAKCNNLTYGGFTDWRLPTEHDLQTAAMHGIRDLWFKGGTAGTASNNDDFAPDVDYVMFWASTAASSDTTNAWSVFLTDGTSSTYGVKSGTTTKLGSGSTDPSYPNSVICVRP